VTEEQTHHITCDVEAAIIQTEADARIPRILQAAPQLHTGATDPLLVVAPLIDQLQRNADLRTDLACSYTHCCSAQDTGRQRNP